MKHFARSPIFLSLILSAVVISGCRQEAGYSANFPAMGMPTPPVAPHTQFATLPPADFVSVSELELAADDTIDSELLEAIPGAPPRGAAAMAAEVQPAPAPPPPAATPAPVAAPAPAPAPRAASLDVNMDVLATYARATGNNVGEKIYRRLQISREAARVACAAFGNVDEAQSMFLFRGGPAEDPLNLDPDGDGFACGWSPAPFRN